MAGDQSFVQRGQARGRKTHVGMMPQQQLDRFGLPDFRSKLQRGIVAGGPGLHIGAVLEEQFSRRNLAGLHGFHEEGRLLVMTLPDFENEIGDLGPLLSRPQLSSPCSRRRPYDANRNTASQPCRAPIASRVAHPGRFAHDDVRLPHRILLNRASIDFCIASPSNQPCRATTTPLESTRNAMFGAAPKAFHAWFASVST